MSEKLSVAFQGTGAGLVIALDDALRVEALLVELQRKLDASGDFFADAQVTLDAGGLVLDASELKQFVDMVQAKHGLRVAGLRATARETRAAADLVGVALAQPPRRREPDRSGRSRSGRRGKTSEGLPTELFRGTVRSGQIFESPGHLVVLGEVNAGAELVAGGDIIVFGTLRGIAHAGATGNEAATIVALRLQATQLRIAGRVARGNTGQSANSGAEYAFVDDGAIMIENWTGARKHPADAA